MKKIVVTTDFSSNSKAGMRFAIQLQAQSNCELVFFHAVSILKPTSWSEKQFKNLADERIARNTTTMLRLVTDLYLKAGRIPNNYHCKIEIGMDPGKMAIACAKKIKADFICMSTHGAGSRIQKILGTHASELIKNSSVPIFVVPKKYRIKPLMRIFYASDFSNLGKELKVLEQFSTPLQLKIKIVHYDYLLHVPENKKKLEAKAAKYSLPNATYVFKQQNIEVPLSDHLRKDIAKENPSLVILFTKQNRNWFDRLFMSSEALDMAFHLQVPLLVYRKK